MRSTRIGLPGSRVSEREGGAGAAGGPGRTPPSHPLDPIFRPSSVAVIGASADPRKRGFQVLRALVESGWSGRLYPVNPKGGEVLGLAVYPSVAAIPEAPDLALICTPAPTVPDVLAACGAKGVRGAVVLAVGFRESGEDGAGLEARVLEAARRSGIRVVGPNTSGLLNLPLGLNLIGARGVRAGSISLLVQSGNIALTLMNEVTARSAEGIAVAVGVGNELDLAFHEYLDFLGRHEETRAIICYVEGFRDARAFLQVAAEVARVKPVLVLKGARSASGQAAARSHTGAVSGAYDTLRAGLLQAGVVEMTRTDELLHVAETLASQPAVRGAAGIAILSDGGGQGTLASDALSDLGAPLAVLSRPTRDALRARLGPASAVGNPVDLAGSADADPEAFGRALEILAADPGVGAVLVVGLFGGYAIRFAEELAEAEVRAAHAMARAMRAHDKALVVHSMYAVRRSAPLLALGEARVPVVESLDVACRCVAETWRRGRLLERRCWRPGGGGGAGTAAHPAAAHSVDAPPALAAARASGRDTLTEPEARALLVDAGLAFASATLCVNADQAAAAVEALSTRAALKVVSPRIPHKTDAGGIMLGVGSAAEARTAFRAIEERTAGWLAAEGLPSGIDGVLVTPMLAPPLAELLVGARRDPEVGPVLTVGAGGLWVEVLADVAHRVLPVDADDIAEMLTEMRTYGLLTGARGRAPADLAAVVTAAEAVARCLLSHEDIAEVEVNPLFVYASGVAAADARVFLTKVDVGVIAV